MILNDILQNKGSQVLTTTPGCTLAKVVRLLLEHNVGSLIVCEGEQMVGIITERDILRASDSRKTHLEDITVKDFMSSPVITGLPDDKVNDVMGLLTDKRIRHLPVLADGKLAGMISIGDVVKAQHDHLSVENHYLKNYIHG